LRTNRILSGETDVPLLGERLRTVAIPVCRAGEVDAVLSREWSTAAARRSGDLETAYLSVFDRLAVMMHEGAFPYSGERSNATHPPRVGDGVVLVDESMRVEYASPNAVSAMHRLGITANAIGLRLSELGFYDSAVRAAFDSAYPVTEEVEQGPDVTLLVRCLPLLASGKVTGAVVLMRDVSELRRRDRLLLSKDATIREIHHRVKNNLQTISSLLRLQSRRLVAPEAKAAIEESVRRIRTIALVHETLSREAGEDVSFLEIMRPLARMVEEGLTSPDRAVRFKVKGDGGKLPAHTATPLAVVLTELLQNAVDHAFPVSERRNGDVVVVLANDGTQLGITVVDDGVGLDPGFSIDKATGLGLSIVRTLVTTELAGTIEMRQPTSADFERAGITPAGPGTVVELSVPITQES